VEAVEAASEGEPRLGTEVAAQGGSAIGREAEGGAAESARDVNGVVGACCGAEDCVTGFDGSAADDIAGDAVGFGKVASGENGVVGFGEREKAIIETIDPRGGDGGWEGERKEAEAGHGSHGSEVRESTGEGFVAEVGRAVGRGEEVDALNEEVGCEDEVFG